MDHSARPRDSTAIAPRGHRAELPPPAPIVTVPSAPITIELAVPIPAAITPVTIRASVRDVPAQNPHARYPTTAVPRPDVVTRLPDIARRAVRTVHRRLRDHDRRPPPDLHANAELRPLRGWRDQYRDQRG